ncbi:MAG: rod-binding protein [Planctomycetota bacterium]
MSTPMSLDGLTPLSKPADGQLPSPKQAHAAAEQFEALFLQRIVQSMREGASSLTGGSLLGDGPGSDVRESWFDSMMAEHVASTGRVGLAEVLYQDWQRAGKVGPGTEDPDGGARPQEAGDEPQE